MDIIAINLMQTYTICIVNIFFMQLKCS